MRAAPRSQGPKVLRIAKLLDGKVIEEKVIASRGDVTVGSAHANTFLAGGASAPDTTRLFALEGNDYVLDATRVERGRLMLKSGVCNLGDGAAADRVLGASKRIPLSDDARGKVQVGDSVFLFQFVEPPPPSTKAQLPLSARGAIAGHIDWSFTVIAACSFLAHFALAGAVNGDWFDPAVDEERETAALIEQARARPPVEIEAKPISITDDATKTNDAGKPDPKVASNDGTSTKSKPGPGGTHPGKPGPSLAGGLAALDDIDMRVLGSFDGVGPALSSVMKKGAIATDDKLDEVAKKTNGASTDGDRLKTGGPAGDPLAKGDDALSKIGNAKSNTTPSKTTLVTPDGPKIPISEPTPGPVVGSGAPEDVNAVIAKNRWRFRACLVKEVAVDEHAGGTVSVMVKVGDGGTVLSSSAASTTASASLTSCLVSSFYTMKFAEPKDGLAQFKVPIVMNPAK